MAKKKKAKLYTVILGCNTSDGTRYEVGDVFDPANHTAEDLEELMRCLEENGDR